MDEFKLDELSPPQSSTTPQWSGIPSIPLAYQLNEQCVDMLCELAETPSLNAFPCIAQNRDLWRQLYREARKRLGAFPFVIVHARFRDDDWWPQIAEKCSMASVSGIPSTLSESLMLETLLFARQVVREDLNVGKVIFGMSTAVATCIGQLTLAQIRVIALSNAHELRVRWSDDPAFWRELLIAARDGDESTLAALRHHAKRRFCGEFIKP